MKKTINIREYRETDRTILKQFIGELHDFIVATDPIKRIRHLPGFVDNEYTKTIKTASNQGGKIFLAENEESLVGMIICIVGKKQTMKNLLEVIPTRLGTITDLYVLDEHRNAGVGTKLLAFGEKYLKEQGCDSIWIEIFAPNHAAWKFYNKNGYLNREVGVLKRLS